MKAAACIEAKGWEHGGARAPPLRFLPILPGIQPRTTLRWHRHNVGPSRWLRKSRASVGTSTQRLPSRRTRGDPAPANKAYAALREVNDPWIEVKKQEVLGAIQLAAGLWIDAAADRWDATPGSDLEITLSALNRSRFPLTWARTQITGVAGHTEPGNRANLAYNEVSSTKVSLRIPDFALYSQPEWLERPVEGDSYGIHDPTMIGRPEARPVLEATFYLKTAEGLELPFRKPVAYRWVDRALGERTRALQIVPPVAVSFAEKTMIFPDANPQAVTVRLENNAEETAGKVKLDVPEGWTVKPAAVEFVLRRHGQQRTANFSITPPAADSTGEVVAAAELGGKVMSSGVRAIEYPHIPIQVVYPKARIRVARAEVKLLAKRIGYVMGAGDNVPEALEQLGASVTLLSPTSWRPGISRGSTPL